MNDPPGSTRQLEATMQIGKPERIIEVTPDERDHPSPREPEEVERKEERQGGGRRRKERVPADSG